MQHLHHATLGAVRCCRAVGSLKVTVSDYPAGLQLPLHEHASAYLCLVLRGDYWQSAGRQTHECTRGMLLVHPNGHRHANRFAGRDTSCLNIHQVGGFDDDPATRRLLDDHRCVLLPDAARLQRRIERELVARDTAADLALQSAILELVAAACRHGEPRCRREPDWLARVRERLHDDPVNVPTLPELAVLGGVHPSHLARRFQRTHGMSIGEYQRRLRIERACKAMLETRMPISAIAADAGFADQSHFTRVFLRVTGETPRVWRTRMQD